MWRLIVQIQGQANKLVIHNRLGVIEFVAFSGPGTHNIGTPFFHELVNLDHGVNKLVRIANLVTQAIDGYGFAG